MPKAQTERNNRMFELYQIEAEPWESIAEEEGLSLSRTKEIIRRECWRRGVVCGRGMGLVVLTRRLRLAL